MNDDLRTRIVRAVGDALGPMGPGWDYWAETATDAVLAVLAESASGDETARLAQWKAEALEVLAAWERVWEALGKPGALGGSKAEATLAEVRRRLAESAGAPTVPPEQVIEAVARWVSDYYELVAVVDASLPCSTFREDARAILAVARDAGWQTAPTVAPSVESLRVAITGIFAGPHVYTHAWLRERADRLREGSGQ